MRIWYFWPKSRNNPAKYMCRIRDWPLKTRYCMIFKKLFSKFAERKAWRWNQKISGETINLAAERKVCKRDQKFDGTYYSKNTLKLQHRHKRYRQAFQFTANFFRSTAKRHPASHRVITVFWQWKNISNMSISKRLLDSAAVHDLRSYFTDQNVQKGSFKAANNTTCLCLNTWETQDISKYVK